MSHRIAVPPRAAVVDSLRGAALIVMAINHIPSELRVLTDGGLGYVSAAECFVFLSGLLAGYVYCRRARERGSSAVFVGAFTRAFAIYRAHLACVIGVWLWANVFRLFSGDPAPGAPSLFSERPLASLLAAATLVQQPGLLDILPLYCLMFVALPWLVAALVQGRTRSVLAISTLLWLASGLFGNRTPYIAGLINSGALNLLAWQLLFVLGLIFGDAWSRAARMPLVRTRGVGLAIVLPLAIAVAAARHNYLTLPSRWDELLTNKINLGPLRLLNLCALAYLAAFIAQRRPNWLTWRLLMFLGQHSLPAFSVHVLAASIVLAFPAHFDHGVAARSFGAALLVGSMFAAAGIASWLAAPHPALSAAATVPEAQT